MALSIEVERETDKRWIAEVTNLPGVMAYGTTRKQAVAKAQALAHRVVADHLKPSKKAQESAEDAGLSKILRQAKSRNAKAEGIALSEMKRQLRTKPPTNRRP